MASFMKVTATKYYTYLARVQCYDLQKIRECLVFTRKIAANRKRVACDSALARAIRQGETYSIESTQVGLED